MGKKQDIKDLVKEIKKSAKNLKTPASGDKVKVVSVTAKSPEDAMAQILETLKSHGVRVDDKVEDKVKRKVNKAYHETEQGKILKVIPDAAVKHMRGNFPAYMIEMGHHANKLAFACGNGDLAEVLESFSKMSHGFLMAMGYIAEQENFKGEAYDSIANSCESILRCANFNPKAESMYHGLTDETEFYLFLDNQDPLKDLERTIAKEDDPGMIEALRKIGEQIDSKGKRKELN